MFIIFTIIDINYIKIVNSSICSSKDKPFLKNGECISFCSKEELESRNCTVDEETVKLQYMTNLIIIGEKDYRYININSNQYNDIVIQTSKNPGTGERLFYGLTNNGRFLFKDENETEFPYLSFNISEESTQCQERYEGESSFIQLYDKDNTLNNGKEYYLSIGKKDQYAELFNFDSKYYSIEKSNKFFEKEIVSDRGTFIRLRNIKNDDYDYFYLLVAVNKDNDKYYFYMKTYHFSSEDISKAEDKDNEDIECLENKMISCFETLKGKIICFYRKENNNKINYYISIFKCCFSEKKNVMIEVNNTLNCFYKAIHLKQEIGVFLYFKDEQSNNPFISFKICSYNEDDDDNYSIEDYNSLDMITLDFPFNYYYMLNDILKISDTKICYISTNLDKTELYVVILTLYNNDKNINIKYYIQSICQQNHYMIYKELRLSLYINQYITLATSVCNSISCETDKDEHYASFLIFSYPNSTDVNIDLIQLLNETNEEISKISFNLENYTKIENNLFGYVFKGIKIINYPNDIKLRSSKTNSEIPINYTMSQNENFTLLFNLNEKYHIKKYIIEYALVITEGIYENPYKIISKMESCGDEVEIIENGDYIGRTSFFNIIIKEELSTNCGNDLTDNCTLCLSDKTYCITCKNEYRFKSGNKICQDEQSIYTSVRTAIPSIIPLILNSTSTFKFEYSSLPITIFTDILSNISSNSQIPMLQEKFECTKEAILDNKCKEGKLTDKQIEDLYNYLKENIINYYNNTNIVIQTKNIIFQISTLNQQKDIIYSNLQ